MLRLMYPGLIFGSFPSANNDPEHVYIPDKKTYLAYFQHRYGVYASCRGKLWPCDLIRRLSVLLQIEMVSTDDYYKEYGLTKQKLRAAKKDVIVMHPGPINRGIEIDSDVADGKHSVILDQVSSGIAIRMSIMSLIFKNRKSN